MTSPYAHGPADTATVIDIGKYQARAGMRAGLGCSGIGLLVALGGVGVMAGDSLPKGIVGTVFGLVIAALGISFLVSTRKERNSRVYIDQVGFWVSNTGGNKVIPWDSLAGVGLHWSKPKKGTGTQYSIELCPNGPIDRDHPALWGLVRDEEPLAPSLPRLRYRVPATGPFREPMVAAIQTYVPHLWLGEVEREFGHMGHPDVRGHRQRIRARGDS